MSKYTQFFGSFVFYPERFDEHFNEECFQIFESWLIVQNVHWLLEKGEEGELMLKLNSSTYTEQETSTQLLTFCKMIKTLGYTGQGSIPFTDGLNSGAVYVNNKSEKVVLKIRSINYYGKDRFTSLECE